MWFKDFILYMVVTQVVIVISEISPNVWVFSCISRQNMTFNLYVEITLLNIFQKWQKITSIHTFFWNKVTFPYYQLIYTGTSVEMVYRIILKIIATVKDFILFQK